MNTVSPNTVSPNTISPFVLWYTGLPSSGKTTLAKELVRALNEKSIQTEHLDGDVVRAVTANTRFDKEGREQHLRQMGFLASRLEHHGVSVIASFVSPFRASRDFVRDICENFIEVHVVASLETCEQRDVKGLYKKARSGKITGFTGVDDPYEAPQNPELVLQTDVLSVEECTDQTIAFLISHTYGLSL